MDYYKFTNKKEKHNGLQYHDGLNIDVLPFNPKGDCEPGGIYFAQKDIFAFLIDNYWIRKVSLPDGEPIYKNPKKPEKWKAHSVIFGKRRKITVKVIDELIKSGADIHADNDYALRWASGHGHKEIVELLIKSGADIHAGNDYALRWAAENGHKEIVELLKGIK